MRLILTGFMVTSATAIFVFFVLTVLEERSSVDPSLLNVLLFTAIVGGVWFFLRAAVASGMSATSRQIEELFDEVQKLKHPSDVEEGEHLFDQPTSVSIRNGKLIIQLTDGRMISTPLHWYPWLMEANTTKQQNYRIGRNSIFWNDLKKGVYVSHIIRGTYRPQQIVSE